MKLASQIVLIIFVSLLPIVGDEIYNASQLYQSRDAETRKEALRQAELAASELNRIIEGMRGMMTVVAQAPSARALDTELCSPFLERIIH